MSAKQFYKTGFGDDAIGLEIGVEPWIQGLFPALLNHFNVFSKIDVPIIESKEFIQIDKQMDSREGCPIMHSNEKLSQLNQLTLPLISSKFESFKIKTHESIPEEYMDESRQQFFFRTLPVMDSKIYDSTLIETKLLTNKCVDNDIEGNDTKVIMEAKFRVENEESLDYEAGDSFGFIVGNCDEEVIQLLKCLDLTEEHNFCEILSPEVFPHLPRFSKIYDLLKYYLEIRSVPKKSSLRHLSDFCGNPSHKRRLLELSSREGDEDYNQFIRKDFVGLLEILQIFDSCRPPLDVLLGNCSPFTPRYYSVINTQNPDNKNEFRIVFSVLNYETKNLRKGSQLSGVFTGTLFRTLLEDLSPEESIANRLEKLSLQSNKQNFKVFKRKNPFFKLPTDSSRPILMVGPGTGVAPFLGFLEQRKLMASKGSVPLGESWLFYGCRHSALDFIYEKQLKEFLSEKVLNQLFVCFSRQSKDESIPKYVQHLILKESKAVYRLIDGEKAVVYVCGDIKSMSSDIFNAFVKVIEECGQQSRENAVKYMREMQSDKRYLQDIWS